jgi:hypothetical protein
MSFYATADLLCAVEKLGPPYKSETVSEIHVFLGTDILHNYINPKEMRYRTVILLRRNSHLVNLGSNSSWYREFKLRISVI